VSAEAASNLYQELKLFFIDGSGLSKDALHIYGGLAIYLAARLLLPRWRWLAWTLVLLAALGGEWLDMRGEHLRGDLQPDAAHWHDVWNTLFWPTILLLVERWWPPAATRQSRSRAVPVEPSDEDAERRLEQA
jgi:hypothetical protein